MSLFHSTPRLESVLRAQKKEKEKERLGGFSSISFIFILAEHVYLWFRVRLLCPIKRSLYGS
jgi:hypothetical protein